MLLFTPSICKIIQGELIVLHSTHAALIDDQFFPENFNMVYDTVELTEFDMFKEEIPKLRAIAEACNLENIKMSHRLMEGDLIAILKRLLIRIKLTMLLWEPPV
jgi:hypothetical protein